MTNLGTGGSAYNALLVNSASISTSTGSYAVGTGAATFSAATSDYIQINSQYLSFGTNCMSFAFWFKVGDTADKSRAFDFGNNPPGGTGKENTLVPFLSNTPLPVSFITSNAEVYLTNAWGANLDDNTWKHVVWTIDPSGNWLFYLNGGLVSSYPGSGYPNNVARQYNYLGRSGWTGDSYFTGEIDEFYLFTYVITAAQARAL